MRLRKLQVKDENNEWYDDAYAYEDNKGQVIFRYNLTWERIGSHYNGKLKETSVALEAIETVIPAGDEMRWMPIEVIAPNQTKTYLEALDETCAIPKPSKVSIVKAVAA